MDTKHIHISDYNYDLPDERIAKFPLTQRDRSKLLVYNHGEVSEDTFCNLPEHLPSGALMVFNNTKVIQARMHFRKDTGALIEVFLLEPAEPTDYEQIFQTHGRCSWYCLVGNLKKWKEGTLSSQFTVHSSQFFDEQSGRAERTVHSSLTSEAAESSTQFTIKATRGVQHGTSHRIDFEWSTVQPSAQPMDACNQKDARTLPSFAEVIDAIGELPIPPYLNRKAQESDKTTYQTVYSKIKGSVAAPTAGLHFTPEVLAAIDKKGIEREELTLHVGAGTFKPVKSEEIEGHEMHTEFISVRRETIDKLISHQGHAIAVGTTSVRTLESLYWMGVKTYNNPDIDGDSLHVMQWEPYDCNSDLDTLTALKALAQWMDARTLSVLHSSTQIIIAPGYDYRIVKMLVTNFHQPQSTLLLLVSAFVHGDWHKIYDYALAHDFRFLSYGDSSLLIP